MAVKQSLRDRILAFLRKTYGRNTFSAGQARVYFGTSKISPHINGLRKSGFAIYANTKRRGNGTPVTVYRLGNPSKSMKRDMRNQGIRPQAA